MVFSKPIFLFGFLPIVLILYYACPRRLKNTVLLIMSLIFYAWGEPRFVFLMLFTIIVDYIAGRLIAKFSDGSTRHAARTVLILAMVINLGLLCYFKYANFIIENLNVLLKGRIEPLNIALPIGISFYTFQTMSYVIDVYRKEIPAEKNILNFAAYVTLFPQLIAGPIVQYKTIADELSVRRETTELFAEGVWRFSVGLGKKVLLANQIGALWTEISGDPGSLTAGKAWIGALAFTFQIYFDFSGYSDMAIGLGKMFGFHFLENFDHPYVSKSITEFWRRWHISLGTWFREYVYIPLGGNRKGLARQIFNILVVWMLTGLWHGASWNFVGALLRSDFSFGKDLFAEIFKKNPSFFLAFLQLAADHIRMGHFRMRIAGRNCLLPESDVFGWRTWLERGNDVCPCQFCPAACCAGRLLDGALRKAREKDEERILALRRHGSAAAALRTVSGGRFL